MVQNLQTGLLLLISLAFYSSAHTQTTLIKDLNPGPGWSNFKVIFEKNDQLIFTATGPNGSELWMTDGTTTGTVMVKDINPGLIGSDPEQFTLMNGWWYFTANDGTHGFELWRTDGTAEGTQLVKDINPGFASSSPDQLFALANTLYFSANDGTHGFELWKTDGSEGGTQLVRDINTTGESAFPRDYTALGNRIVFAADDGMTGQEIWSSDGTPEGTALLRDIYPGIQGSFPAQMNTAGNYVFFTADNGLTGTEIWRTDGSSEGTQLLADISPGIGSSSPQRVTGVGDKLYFAADDPQTGLEFYWVDAGADSLKVVLEDLHVGQDSSFPSDFFSFNGELYFNANNSTNGFELWKSNGTPSGTQIVKDISSGFVSSDPVLLASTSSLLYFYANDGIHGFELWQTDGTANGTKLVKDINPIAIGGEGNSYPTRPVVVDQTLYFSAFNELKSWQIWKTTGDEQGAILVTDIPRGVIYNALFVPFFVQAQEDTILFVTLSEETGEEFFKYRPVPLDIENLVVNSPLLCHGDNNGSIAVNIAGGIGPSVLYKYQWSVDSDGSATLENLTAGTYGVTVTDCGGQTVTAEAVIIQPGPLSLIFSEIAAPSCLAGQDGSALVTAAGGTPPYTYLWDSGETSASAGSLDKGEHSVTISDGNGCSKSALVAVPGMTPQAEQIQGVSCQGEASGRARASVDGQSEGFSFLWDNGETEAVAVALTAGLHRVTITENTNCQAVVEVEISELPKLQLNLVGQDITCFAATTGHVSAQANGGAGPYRYLWSTGAQSAQVNGLAAGEYRVTLVDATGCEVADTIHLIQPDSIQLTLVQSGADCLSNNGGAALATASGGTPGYNFEWDTGTMQAQVEGLSAGWHTLTLTDAQNCIVEDSVLIQLNEALTASVLTSQAIGSEANGTAVITTSGGVAPYQYEWTADSVRMDTLAFDLAPGSYQVTVTDSDGCILQLSFEIEMTVGLLQPGPIHYLNIYPNPARDRLIIAIQVVENRPVEFGIFDLRGQLLTRWRQTTFREGRLSIDTNNLANGMYVLRATVEGRSVHKKFVVLR